MGLFLTFTLLGLLAAGCGSTGPAASAGAGEPAPATEPAPAPSQGPVEITFWHAMTGHHEEALKAIADRFMAEHPEIRVKLVGQGSYNDLQDKILAAAKAKTLPTAAQVIETWVTDYIQNGLVVNLDAFIRDPEVGWSQGELDDIVEVFRKMNQWDGHYYSLPFSKSTQILFYNTDYFSQKSLQPPTTWEELEKAARALTFTEKGRKVVGFGLENSVGWGFQMWVRQAGGRYIDETTGKVEFDSPEGKKALSFLRKLMDEKIARLAGEDGYLSNPFGRGDVAMYIGSSAGIPFVASAAQGNIQWAAVPVPGDVQKAVPFGGNAVTIFSSASPEEQKAAWLFIRFLLNTDNTAYWAKETGYLPIRYSALESPIWKDFVKDHPANNVGTEQFSYGYFDPRVPGFDAALKDIQAEVMAVLIGEKGVDEGLQQAAQKAQAAIDRAMKRSR